MRGAVILAGGRSRRMGAPKAWIDWGGRPLLLHVLEQVRRVCDGPLVVVGAAGQSLPPLPDGVTRVDDPPEEDRGGPLIGILAGLRALDDRNKETAGSATAELAYLGACDSVELDAAHVRFMLAALERDPARSAAVPRDPPDPRGRRFLHPLASAVRVTPALRAAEAIAAEGGRRPLFLFERLATRYIDADALPNPDVLRTCNTPEELARARARALARTK